MRACVDRRGGERALSAIAIDAEGLFPIRASPSSAEEPGLVEERQGVRPRYRHHRRASPRSSFRQLRARSRSSSSRRSRRPMSEVDRTRSSRFTRALLHATRTRPANTKVKVRLRADRRAHDGGDRRRRARPSRSLVAPRSARTRMGAGLLPAAFDGEAGGPEEGSRPQQFKTWTTPGNRVHALRARPSRTRPR